MAGKEILDENLSVQGAGESEESAKSEDPPAGANAVAVPAPASAPAVVDDSIHSHNGPE